MDLTKYFQFQGIWLRRRYFIDDFWGYQDDSDGNPVLIYATPPQVYPCVAPSDPADIFSTPVGEIYVTGAGFEPKVYKDIFIEYGLGRISFLLVDAWGDRKVIPLIENIYDAPEPYFEYRDGDYSGLLYPSHYGTDAIVPPGTTEIFASCTLTEEERCEKGCIEIYRESDNAYICICKETEGPTLAPTQNRISKPKRPQPYTPSLDPPVKQAVIAQRRKSQKLAPQVKQAQERYEAKEAELLATPNPSPETLHEANRALIGWDKLRNEKEEADAYVAANTTESERQTGVIIDPGRPVYTPEIIPFPGGYTVKPMIVRPTVNRTVVTPTINRTVVTPTIITPTINRNVVTPTIITPTINRTVVVPTINRTVIYPTINRGVVYPNQQPIESEPLED